MCTTACNTTGSARTDQTEHDRGLTGGQKRRETETNTTIKYGYRAPFWETWVWVWVWQEGDNLAQRLAALRYPWPRCPRFMDASHPPFSSFRSLLFSSNLVSPSHNSNTFSVLLVSMYRCPATTLFFPSPHSHTNLLIPRYHPWRPGSGEMNSEERGAAG